MSDTQELLTEVTRIGEDSVELKFGKWRFTWGRDDALEIAQAMIEAVSPHWERTP